jgi:DNA-binding transcriptional LysR family regulator
METEKCRAVLRAVKTGSLTAAAEQLGYTISGVSRMIASLEEETGVTLLRRSHGGVTPTRECETLLPVMQELIYQADNYAQTAASLRGLEQGTIVIGTSYGMYFRRLAGLIAAFEKQYPNIKFDTFAGMSSELSAALEARRADFCIISHREGAFEWLSLKRDQLLIMLPKNHPLASRKALPLTVFEAEPFIELYPGEESDNSRCLARNQVHPQTRFTCADPFAALAMVEAGLGMTMVNAVVAETLQGDAVFLPVDPPQYVDIGIAMPSAAAAPPAVKRFMEFVKLHREEL